MADASGEEHLVYASDQERSVLTNDQDFLRLHMEWRSQGEKDVAAYYSGGWSAERIADDLRLHPAQVHAALAYYFDHQGEIEQTMTADVALARTVGRSSAEARQIIETRKKGN